MTEYDDRTDYPVLISAIEHYSYCPRQCGLIHVEQTYAENRYTIRGNHAHERVDSGVDSVAQGIRSKRDVPVWSDQLGLQGKADMVEFRAAGPYPVEYKVGRRRDHHPDLQLCAIALCLEEMLGEPVAAGAIYYHATRSRYEVAIDKTLRTQTLAIVERIRSMLTAQQLPSAPNDQRCRRCSLLGICLPDVIATPKRIQGFQSVLFVPAIPGADE